MIEGYETVGADSISALEPKMIHEFNIFNEFQRAERDAQRAEIDSAPTYKYNRKSLRLKHYDYSRKGYYFITIVAQNREHLFGEIVDGNMVLGVAGLMVEALWYDIPNDFKHVKLHECIIMPNHIHGIIQITNPYDTDIKPVGADSISALNWNAKNIHDFQRVDMESTPTQNNMDTKRAEMDSQRAEMDSQRAEMDSQRAEIDSAPTLSTIVQSFKRHTTLRYIKMVKNGTLPSFNKRIWQRNYYEHVIRDENDYVRITDYIENNPITWELDRLNEP